MGLLERNAADLRKLATEAAELEKAWADAELAHLRKVEADTKRKREAAEMVLKPR